MGHRFLELVTTPSVARLQEEDGSRSAYARLAGGPATHARLSPREAEFIAARDSFYMASVSETGWPYVQHRGGAPGFVRALDAGRLVFPDYGGNRQHVSAGNLSADGRVAMIFVDYPNRRRLKLLGRAEIKTRETAPELFDIFASEPPAERAFLIAVEAFDWNCPKQITPRFTEAEVEAAAAPLRARLAALEQDNARLRALLSGMKPS